jgi:hypothetical protein
MILLCIRTLIDALTRDRPVHMHASDFDVEKGVLSRGQTIPYKSRPVWTILSTIYWCILLVVCRVRLVMYYFFLVYFMYT